MENEIKNYSDDELLAAYTAARKSGIPTAEIAADLGVSYNSLRWKIHTIRQKNKIRERNGEVITLKATDVPPEIMKTAGKDDPNYTEIETTDARIKTLDQLIAAARIDLDVWSVERWIVNKWEVGAKTARRKLTWENGLIVDGFLDDPGELTVEPLYQIKAWLIRKKPIAVNPTITPVEIRSNNLKAQPRRIATDSDPKIRRALIVPDMQFGFSRDLRSGRLDPFHDRRAVDIVLQISERTKPDRIVFLGDLLDLPDWSDKYPRTPEFYFNTQPAIVELAWWLSQFRRSAPDAEIDYIEGNHERRMIAALRAHLNAAYSLRPANEIDLPESLSIPRLLDLDKLSIEYHSEYPDGVVWLSPSVLVTHGEYVRSSPGDTAKHYVQVSDVSVIFGHIHRRESASRTIASPRGKRRISAVSPGALCRMDNAVPGDKSSNNWQQGFAVVYYDASSDFHQIETVEITDGFSIYGGERLIARDHIEQISNDTGWNLR